MRDQAAEPSARAGDDDALALDVTTARQHGRDRGVIQLMLIETNTRHLVDSARIRNRGGFLTFYDQKPEDLIGPPLEEYARSLIGLSR